jgi:lipopolysaccharide heptosyltransferase I
VKILIVKMSAIGDVTHTLPALTALRRHYPQAEISWLLEETAAEVVRGHPALDHLLVWRRRELTTALRSGRFITAARQLLRFTRELRSTSFDLLIDFQALLKSSVWVFLARARRKAGFGPGMEHAEGSYWFLNQWVPAVSMEMHALDRGLALLEALGIPRPPVVYDFPILPENESAATGLLHQTAPITDGPLVVIHVMTRWPTKQWPDEHFGAVADALMGQGIRVAFSGGPGDGAVLDRILQGMKEVPMRLDGRTDLKTLAAVYRRAQLVLTTDTGPMHIAVAVGTPVVAIFGPTAPWRTGPHGAGHTVLRAGVDCSPCFRRHCRTRDYEPLACMRRITVDQVVTAVVEKLRPAPATDGPRNDP